MRVRVSPPGAEGGGRDVVALVLAVGVSLSLLVIVVAVMWDAVRSDTPGLSENATQILTGWGGGVLGILGSYLGFQAGSARARRDAVEIQDDPPG